jgi:N-methylhydantoinase A
MRSSGKPAEIRIAVDTGGTFTDCVWVENGRVRMLKVFSTPDDPSRAIIEGITRILDAARPRAAHTLTLLHGTTVGTNTLLQRKGARVAFVTTKGFEDTIEIGRQARPKLYDFFFDRIEPLVPSDLRFGVAERTAPAGDVLQAPNDLDQLTARIKQQHPDAVAVSLLFSFANPENELRIAEALKQLDVPLSFSHQLLPEFREYERASTVVVNAYLQPVMERYLHRLAEETKELDAARPRAASDAASAPLDAARPRAARVFVMQSSGGITSLDIAAREPVRTVLSGPAGGVVGASAMARLSGFHHIIGFDMGGTSTDVALVSGEARATNEAEVAGLPVRIPMLDIHTVGAGGGSLARFDAAGSLRVGPESAGADPGPICYGRGEQPTVTDANLLLGRLRPEAFLGGEFTLDLERTRRLVTEWLKRNRSTLSVEQFAAGVIRVVNATMEKAIRVVSIERGYDPRDFALVAFGGAGGLHACELAASLSIPTVIVPALPGALSAYGILVSDVVKDYSRTVLCRADTPVRPSAALTKKLDAEFRALTQSAEREFKNEGWTGKPTFSRTADLRYRGQGFELNVEYSPNMLADFHAEHRRRYGYSSPQREVEIVTVRLHAKLPQAKVNLNSAAAHSATKPQTANVFFDTKFQRAQILARESLPLNQAFRGPAIVTEYSATTVAPAGSFFSVDPSANLIIKVKNRS